MIGVSFHVGSLAKSGKAFHRAIECARKAFDVHAIAHHDARSSPHRCARKAFDVGTSCGFHFSLLDIGGGFTGRFNSCGIVQSMVGDIPACINEALSMQVLTTTPLPLLSPQVGEIPAYINEALDRFFGPETPYSDLR